MGWADQAVRSGGDLRQRLNEIGRIPVMSVKLFARIDLSDHCMNYKDTTKSLRVLSGRAKHNTTVSKHTSVSLMVNFAVCGRSVANVFPLTMFLALI